MTKPVWFLDVDGVLNCCDRYNAKASAWPDYREQLVGPYGPSGPMYPIKFAPALIEVLNEFVDQDLVDVRWLTTWGAAANGDLREFLGIRELPVQGPDDTSTVNTLWAEGWWKWTLVQEFRLEHPNVPIIWTDDDHAIFRDARRVLEEEGADALVIAPAGNQGLTPTDLDEIRAFIARERVA